MGITLKERVEKIFKDNNLNYHCDYNNNTQQVTITIIDGNQFNNHLKLVEIMKRNGFVHIDEYIIAGKAEYYDAEHTFELQ